MGGVERSKTETTEGEPMTKIEWTDKSWNPVTGCTKCSPGCANCYAEANISRLQANPKTAEKYRNGFKVTMHPDELEKPLRWKKPKKIFLCSMGDLFHEDVPFEFVNKVMNVMWKTPHHTYQILTKRAERMLAYFARNHVPHNTWLGVTVCNQAEISKVWKILYIKTVAPLFVSIEPMLEKITLVQCLDGALHNKLSWVIVGGETGRNARPMNPDWARAIRDQCRVSETPFFFKQMSNKQPIPDDLCVREFPMMGGGR